MSSLDSQRWQSVEDGYLRHSETMATIAHEREILRASAFLDPLDGFPALAAAVARTEFIDERKAATERNIPWLLQIFSSTLHDVAREYTGADLSWSKTWIAYQPKWSAWLRDISYFLNLSQSDPEAMKQAMSIRSEQ